MRYVSKFKVNNLAEAAKLPVLTVCRNADKLFHFEQDSLLVSRVDGTQCDDGTVDIVVFLTDKEPPIRFINDDGTVDAMCVSVRPLVPMSHLIPVEPVPVCEYCDELATAFLPTTSTASLGSRTISETHGTVGYCQNHGGAVVRYRDLLHSQHAHQQQHEQNKQQQH